MMQDDLFALANGPMLTPKQRRKLGKRKPTVPNGYAWKPGTGPEGETCGSCAHIARKRMSKCYLKCALMRSVWTGGPGTDIRARSPACAKWEAANAKNPAAGEATAEAGG